MHRKTGLSYPPPPPTIIITDCPAVSFVLWSYVRYCSIYKCFNSNTSASPELPSVWERADNSAYHLLFCCVLRYVCPSFPLMIRTTYGF